MICFTALRSRLSNLVAPLAGVLSVAVGVLGFLNWIVNDLTVKSLVPGLVSMKPNSALAFVLIGIALWCLSLRTQTRVTRWVDSGSAGAVMVIGILLTTLEALLQWEPGFDQWLFRESLDAVGLWVSGRMVLNAAMALNTAVTLFAAGMGILFLHPDRGLMAGLTSDQASSCSGGLLGH